MRVTKTEFIFPAKGGERSVAHTLLIPPTAYGFNWDQPTLTLSYSVPAESEGEEPTEHSLVVEEQQIADAIASLHAPEPVPVDDLVARLWQDFNDYALEQTDLNSRSSIALILANPESTAQQLERAAAWGMWWADHWSHYAIVRDITVTEGAIPDYTLTPAPWTIWQIAE